MNRIVAIASIFLTVFSFAQVQSPDCATAENVCANNGSNFPLSIGQGFVDIPPGNNISNPSNNPQNVNSGCLFSNELNPNWFVINVGASGWLEFTIGAAGGNGFFDWAMWPYYENPNGTSACNDITNNTLPPAACNWNAASAGFTGMWNGGTPPGGNAGNFQPSLFVNAGEAYVLMFSNYSGLAGNAQLSFPSNPGSAMVTCQPGTPDQTICNGETAIVDIVPPPSFITPTYNWLVTNGVSNTAAGTNVSVTPAVTTEYRVEIIDGGTGGIMIDTFTITVVDPHTPNAGADMSVCLGDPIPLTGAVSDPVNNTFGWTHNTAGISPSPSVNYFPNSQAINPNVIVNQVGTYKFILTETNTVCGSIKDTVLVTVSELAISATTVSPSCAGLADGEIHINSPEAIEFSFDGGATWQVDSFDVVFTTGQYTVCGRTVTGCQKCTQVNVVDPAPVIVYVSNDTTVCENGTASMSAWATGGTSYQFHWDHTGSTAADQQVNPLAPTTYTVYAENQNGCASAPLSIDVSLHPPLSGNISPFDTICPGYPTDIWADVSGGIGAPYSFTWSSGETQNGPNNWHQFSVNPPVTQDYVVTITDGCETTPLIMITNIFVAPLPVPQYEVLDPEQCEPAVFHVVNTTNPALSQYNYWLVNGEFEYVNQDTIVTPELYEGAYDIQMIITTFQGCIDSTTFTGALNVKPKPVANFQHSPNPVQMFNTQVVFTSTSYLAHDYEWYFESGYPSTSSQSTVITSFPDGVTGTYDVKLIVTSELGCKDTIDYELIVLPEVVIYAPNAFTPDGDEHNQGWRVFMEGVDIYDFELLVFDRWGQVVWESHDMEIPWDGTLDGIKLPNGTYTWTITTKDLINDAKYEYNGHVSIIH